MSNKDDQKQDLNEEQKQAAQASLSLQDLLIVTQIIQVASERGAIKPEEMASVGGVYNKIVNFLEASGAITKNAPAEKTEEKKDD